MSSDKFMEDRLISTPGLIQVFKNMSHRAAMVNGIFPDSRHDLLFTQFFFQGIKTRALKRHF